MHPRSTALVCLVLAILLSLTLPGSAVAGTAEIRAERVANNVASYLSKTLATGESIFIGEVQYVDKSDPFENDLADAFIGHLVRRLSDSHWLNYDTPTERRSLWTQVQPLLEKAALLPPKEQESILRDVDSLVNHYGYGAFIFPLITKDARFLRLRVQVRGAHLGLKQFSTGKLSRSTAEAEESAFEIGVGGVFVHEERSTASLSEAGTVRLGDEATNGSGWVVWGAYGTGRFRVEGAYVNRSFDTTGGEILERNSSEVDLKLEGILLRHRLLGVGMGLGGRKADDELTIKGSNDNLTGEFIDYEAGLGLTLGTLLNGVFIEAIAARGTAEDTTQGRKLLGLPTNLWDDSTTGIQVRGRRTTRKWDLDLSYRQLQIDREFDSLYYPGLGTASLEAWGLRAEATRRLQGFTIGFVGSLGNVSFIDDAVAAELHQSSDADQWFLGLRIGGLWGTD